MIDVEDWLERWHPTICKGRFKPFARRRLEVLDKFNAEVPRQFRLEYRSDRFLRNRFLVAAVALALQTILSFVLGAISLEFLDGAAQVHH